MGSLPEALILVHERRRRPLKPHHLHLNPPVLLAALGSGVVGDGIQFALPVHDDPLPGDLELILEILHPRKARRLERCML